MTAGPVARPPGDGSLAGRSLIAAGVVFPLFQLGAVVESPITLPWVLALGVHAVAIALLAVGFVGAGRLLEAAGYERTAWWVGALLTVAGSALGWLPFTGGLLLIGVLEVRWGRPLTGLSLATGSALLATVYLRGAHVGDESSRELAGVEPLLFVGGLVLVAVGLIAFGLSVLRRRSVGRHPSDRSAQPPVETGESVQRAK